MVELVYTTEKNLSQLSLPTIPYFGHRDWGVRPGVSQLMAQVGEAGDIEVACLDIKWIQPHIKLTGDLDGESL